ncbi:MAG: NUDIX domain-containing protein [bacterium]|nr:NUDIX domain-containing protein [bacterium]
MKFQGSKSNIHLVVRGFLICKDEIILCRVRNEKWFFLPGGHIEDSESARVALLRELNEEMGENDYKISSFMGVCENIFLLEEGILQHEINIIFKVNVPNEFKVNTKEGHIEFVSIAKNNLKDYKILPATLKDALIEWLENEKSFFKEI